jgi:hypothetical protein
MGGFLRRDLVPIQAIAYDITAGDASSRKPAEKSPRITFPCPAGFSQLVIPQ